MGESLHSPASFFERNRFLLLFLSFVLLFAIEPFLDQAVTIDALVDMLMTIVLVSAVYAISERKHTRIIGFVLAGPFLVARWGLHWVDLLPLKIIGVVFGILFFGYISYFIVKHLFTAKKVTTDLVIASVCGYFLVGLMWSLVYAAIEIVLPGSLVFGKHVGHEFALFSYYSFVTLTTLGYGDIIPITSPARNFAVLEAIIGQIYLTVLVARLVGMHIAHSMGQSEQ